MATNVIDNFRKRRQERNERRAAINDYKWRRVERILTRFDADGDSEEQNNSSGGGSGGAKSGGHGNTKLPFGLCKRFGIEIGADWGPKEAWDALAGEGITADGAYARLKRGEDPGTPDKKPEAEATEVTPSETSPDGEAAPQPEPIPEPVKEPKKSITDDDGREYGELTGHHYSWSDKTPWEITAKTTDESVPDWRKYRHYRFRTKSDMLLYLKKHGVEEFVDPETGEVVNPTEMEFPETVMESGYGYYKALSIGLRDGRYVVFGTDMDGKKVKELDFGTLAGALEWLKRRGVEEDKVKLTPALKKREEARLAWTKSDKKEYIEEDGAKYGNLRVFKGGGWENKWIIEGEDEKGVKHRWEYPTKSDAISFLASQGVDKAKVGYYSSSAEEIDPKTYTPPTEVAKIGRVGYQKLWYDIDYDGKLVIRGMDVDGEERAIARQPWTQSLDDFKKQVADSYGIDLGIVEASPEVQEKIDQIIKEDEEKAKRRREFEAKAVKIGSRKYLNPTLVDDGYGDFKIVGYDESGTRKSVTYGDSMYDVVEFCKREGVDPDTLGMDDTVKAAYEKFKEATRDFDAKAIDYRGRRVADLQLERDGDDYVVYGTDYKGRRRAIERASSYSDLENSLSAGKVDASTLPRSEEAQKAYDKYMRSKHALSTGDYYSFGDDTAYKDIRVETRSDRFGEGDRYLIKGTDVDGDEDDIEYVDTWDDAVSKLEDMGVKSYKITSGGKERQRPAYGMHDISIRRNKGTGGYTVTASSKRFGDKAVMFEGISEKECRDWLENNNVDPDTVATRGMNPHDDVVRTHTMKSLEKFDDHREKEVEKCPTVTKLSSGEKRETADMLTDLFAGSAYRLRADSGYFEKIFDTHFKNLLETHHSGGSEYEPGRRETHVRTFGGDYNVKPIDGEKYGYLGDEDDYNALHEYGGSHYGDVVFKFKKDAVGERTTYTFGDTLDRGRPLAGYAGSKPTIEGITGLTGPRDDASGKMRNILKAYKKFKDGKISINDLRRYIVSESYSNYIECQYHGKLTFEDVDTITMSKNSLMDIVRDLKPEKKEKMLSFFNDHGIKVRYEDNGTLKDGLEYFKR